MDSLGTMQRANRQKRTQVIDIIHTAFVDDPVLLWVVGNGAKQQERLRALITKTIDLMFPFDHIFLSKEENGVGAWIPPENHDYSLWQRWSLFTMFLRVSGIRRIGEMGSFFNELEKEYPKEPFFHLLYLGVLPEFRGQGIGSSLLQPFGEYLDTHQIAAYLENSKEQNLPLYERHGFRTVREWKVFGNGPTIWFMKRAPISQEK
jgi:ribosomal protein S18 acetylase RimI-like enzyme